MQPTGINDHFLSARTGVSDHIVLSCSPPTIGTCIVCTTPRVGNTRPFPYRFSFFSPTTDYTVGLYGLVLILHVAYIDDTSTTFRFIDIYQLFIQIHTDGTHFMP
jgi:hypothetical protein